MFQESQSKLAHLQKIVDAISETLTSPESLYNSSQGSMSPVSPISDYDNSADSSPMSSAKTPTGLNYGLPKAARSLNTSDDYVLDSALSENMQLRHTGFTTQQNRRRSSSTAIIPQNGFPGLRKLFVYMFFPV